MADCRICLQTQERKPWIQQQGPPKKCMLCKHLCCKTYQAKTAHQVSDLSENEPVCEIKHEAYYAKNWHVHTGIFAIPQARAVAMATETQAPKASETGTGGSAKEE